MVKRCVRVYIEGGTKGRPENGDFRRAWKMFLSELHELARRNEFNSLEVVRALGRGTAYRSFLKHAQVHPKDLCFLLVDSETPVEQGQDVWSVVREREGDKWEKPAWATEDHLCLMVEAVETWILTDQDALQAYFKKGFDGRALPTTNLESRDRHDIDRALRNATKNCQKRTYAHGQANEIIGLVRPSNVKKLVHGKRLFDTISRAIVARR